ncbi:SIMPL domain-containing protein [Bartonella henselae]|uniref:SIMPL domain-containing protein n=1 Tax=Bartonella henselae TaxID=38323 RepID=UPI00094B6A03|nr:SIMPL domain-containing protein [Bartonella henselae]MDM9982975.1 SIMPL domain-containing protein [Bartonella henselae]MDM9985297.1 SIMPL domain-containing protein [Bartonella henselae]MDM9986700.1 SIMPL domain-containing protein [Bartonella henselae]MDM9987562.1 SIMPL domain-containing protein [Bartonella henselae]MDM9989052.1 SIMPL domain-containing protein [Bartonella henselae]
MKKVIFKPLKSYPVKMAMIALTLLAASPITHAEESKMKNATITVTATGENQATPDMAIINLAVVTQDKTAQKALADNNKSMNDIINAFKNNGIQANDLQTSGLSIYQSNPNKDHEKKNNGIVYHVSNSLTVRIRDLSNAGKIFDQAMALGVNSVHGITFTNANTKPFYQEARKKAIAEAIEKAKTIAEAADLKLGKIIKINENDDNYYSRPHLMSKAVNANYTDTTFSSGELNYSVSVTIVFAIN